MPTHPVIILIDDDDDDIEMMSQAFHELGVNFISFQSGEEAVLHVNLFLSQQPSLVVLDYNLPARNGMEILSQFKNKQGTKEIPVIMYSTSLSLMLQKKLIEKGAYACIIKPFIFAQVMDHAKIFARLAGEFSKNRYLSKPEAIESFI